MTAGSEKIVNLWKTGYYDSFKEKIVGNEGLAKKNKERVQY